MQIDRGQLVQALNLASQVIENRNTVPILGYTALQPANDGTAIVIGTDLDMEIQIEIPVDLSGRRAAPVMLPTPHKIARVLNLGGEKVEIEEKGEPEKRRLAISSGRLDLETLTLPFEDFPRINHTVANANDVQLSGEDLRTILRVAGAMSKEETRYYLNGVFLHTINQPSTLDAKQIRAVATDGHRLYCAPLALAGVSAFAQHMPKNGDHTGLIIPKQAIALLARLARRISGPISFSLQHLLHANRVTDLAPAKGNTLAVFKFMAGPLLQPVTLITKMIDGAFPAYERILPKTDDADNAIEIDRLALRQAVRMISATGSERTRPIRLTFDPKDGGRLKVAFEQAAEVVKASTWIEAKTNVSAPFDVGYNGAYLDDICAANQGEKLIIRTRDHGSPAAIASPDTDGFRTVLMPMRI